MRILRRGPSAVPVGVPESAPMSRGIARPCRCGKVRRERPADPGIVITKTERLGRRAASPADRSIHQAA